MELYNTLSRRKETFQPREPGKVGMYVCGPTTYNFIHLGNARPLVFFDTVRRYFIYKGYQVNYIQNFTDVDDKIINRAREEGEEPLGLSRKYIDEYFKDADALNVLRADRHPRVSEHIADIIATVAELVNRGFAYLVFCDFYFSFFSFKPYGKLSGRDFDDMQAGARVDVDSRKQDPLDFALWKAAKPGEPSWESPWGPGRPGWHIECSVMSQKYLGPGFDIHGGGSDLIFPHHENEIAQAEAATGETFVRYWLHNGFITVNDEKMSKSLGNFFLVREILEKFAPEVIRFFLLATHYRSPLDFDDANLAAAGKGLERIKTSIRLLGEALDGQAKRPGDEAVAGWAADLAGAVDKCKAAFEAAMDDDFNTALAIGVVFDLAREVNSAVSKAAGGVSAGDLAVLRQAMDLFQSFNSVLGIFKVDPDGKILLDQATGDGSGLVEGLLELIIEIRQQARQKKDWATADRIRDGLKELGVILEDTPQGVRWKKQ